MDANPLISFVLIAFKQECYIREAVRGALAQTYSPLEIILSDDCSPDRTFQIMQEEAALYTGPHEVRLLRDAENHGLAGHCNRAFGAARGEILVIAAGDDVSLPERTASLFKLYDDPSVQSAFSNALIIDEEGKPGEPWFPVSWRADFNSYPLIVSRSHTPMVLGATNSIRKKVWQSFPELLQGVQQEDVVLALRARLLGKIAYAPECLVRYRQHGANLYSVATGRINVGEARSKMNRRALNQQFRADLDTAVDLGKITLVERFYYLGAFLQTNACRVLQKMTGWKKMFTWLPLLASGAMKRAERLIEERYLGSR